ncbi:hypothetical protein EV424DRAFT_1348671 [Suillus variegatus]|nr:hypothetical protein EV424DRAFT_1348671 [Suillus variegatus]
MGNLWLLTAARTSRISMDWGMPNAYSNHGLKSGTTWNMHSRNPIHQMQASSLLDDIHSIVSNQLKDDLILKRMLYKLFHIEEALEAKSKVLASLHAELQEEHEKALENMCTEQARARTAVATELVEKIQEQVSNDAEHQQAKLHSLRGDISSAKQAADINHFPQRERSSQISLTAQKSRVATDPRKAARRRANSDSQKVRGKATLQGDHARSKQEYENQQSKQTRIRHLEAETNEKLANVYQCFIQAGVDRNESKHEAKLKETFPSPQRIFPGIRRRVVDLCKPIQRKYETAVSVILGRNIDAVVVNEEKIVIECINYMERALRFTDHPSRLSARSSESYPNLILSSRRPSSRSSKIRRREARDLVKSNVNEASRVWTSWCKLVFSKSLQHPRSCSSAETAAKVFLTPDAFYFLDALFARMHESTLIAPAEPATSWRSATVNSFLSSIETARDAFRMRAKLLLVAFRLVLHVCQFMLYTGSMSFEVLND